MIPNSVEDIVDKQTRTQQRYRTLTASAIGAGLAIAISMFALKHDINKNYFQLSQRIDKIERYTAPSAPVHVHVHHPEYIVSESCITQNGRIYEVRPC